MRRGCGPGGATPSHGWHRSALEEFSGAAHGQTLRRIAPDGRKVRSPSSLGAAGGSGGMRRRSEYRLPSQHLDANSWTTSHAGGRGMRAASRLATLRAVPSIARTRRPAPVVADLRPCGIRAEFRPEVGDLGCASDEVPSNTSSMQAYSLHSSAFRLGWHRRDRSSGRGSGGLRRVLGRLQRPGARRVLELAAGACVRRRPAAESIAIPECLAPPQHSDQGSRVNKTNEIL